MTIIAQDPQVCDAQGRIVRAKLRVPVERLEPGPRSHRFHVIDYDATRGDLARAADLAPGRRGWAYRDRFKDCGDEVLLTDFAFHAQNVYAIAARTLALFESALGRRIPWTSRGHELYLVPHALEDGNAFYSDADRALYFGYTHDSKGEPIYTCLSHDIVAHETTHALLDGFRPRFQQPALPDQAAFHEAFADIVALLSVLSTEEMVGELLGEADHRGRVPAHRVSETTLKGSALLTLAEQLGNELYAERGSGLRRSVTMEPSGSWRKDPAFDEPHRRGEVLVAAFTQTLLRMWLERLRPLIHADRVDLSRAAEEGAKSAEHLLKMAIRSLDYTPPVEIEFEDFLEAICVSDADLVPDDRHNYRKSLLRAFSSFDIRRPSPGIQDLSRGQGRPQYLHLNYGALRIDRDEVFRFVWENSLRLRLDPRAYTQVDRIRPAVRVGPDGFVVTESVADYVQILTGTAREFLELGQLPVELLADTEIQLWGGGSIVFDQFGGPKYHHAKPLNDWKRQSLRLARLVREGLLGSNGRVGFAIGASRSQWFADFHRPNARAEEDW